MEHQCSTVSMISSTCFGINNSQMPGVAFKSKIKRHISALSLKTLKTSSTLILQAARDLRSRGRVNNFRGGKPGGTEETGSMPGFDTAHTAGTPSIPELNTLFVLLSSQVFRYLDHGY